MSNILIVGAGPVGLSAALWLKNKQFDVDIVDKNDAPTPLSKAVAINPRTLSLFEESGLSEKMITCGNKLYRMNFRHNNEVLLSMDFTKLHHKYNYLLALPQSVTEMLLTEALAEVDLKVMRQRAFVECHEDPGALKVILEESGLRHIRHYDFCVGADGAHSSVRESQGFKFGGKDYPDDWHLVDLEMTCTYSTHEANAFLHGNGVILFMAPLGGRHFRLVSNTACALDYLPVACEIDKIIWQSHFHVHCRQVENYQKGRVFLAGDAAHVHSPAGGRGMNLGIEDAHVLADLIARGETASYSIARHKVGQQVIKDTDRLFRMASMKNPVLRYMRDHVLFSVLGQPTVQKKVLTGIAGLKS